MDVALSLEATYCERLTALGVGPGLAGGGGGDRGDADGDVLLERCEPFDAGAPMRLSSFDFRRRPAGALRYAFSLLDPLTDLAAVGTADFAVGRAPFDRAVFARITPGSNDDSDSDNADADSGQPGLVAGGGSEAAVRAFNPRAPVLSLGLRYGIHGDGARLSVAADGVVVLSTSLASLFRARAPATAAALAAAQFAYHGAGGGARLARGFPRFGHLRSGMAPLPTPSDDAAFAAFAADAARAAGGDASPAATACAAAADGALEEAAADPGRPLADHVALQAATGFGDG